MFSLRKGFFLFIATSLLLTFGSQVRAESVEDTWNLEDLYPTVAAWDAAKAKLETQLGTKERPGIFQECIGKLQDPVVLKKCMGRYFGYLKELWRLEIYANLAYDQDQGNSDADARNKAAVSLDTRFGQTTSFLQPQLKALGLGLTKYIKANPKADETFYLENVRRQAPYICSAPVEKTIAATGDMRAGFRSAYDQLCNVAITWPKVTLSDGKEVTVNYGGYTRYRGVNNREDRKKVFDAFWAKWREFEGPLGSLLSSEIDSHLFARNVRGYPTALASSLDGGGIPEKVYRTLIDQATANLPTLYRYLKLRGRMLGIEDLRYFDLYPPIVTSLNLEFPLPEGKARVLDALAPLGQSYTDVLKIGYENRWIDAFPREGKQGGAYSSGDAYDVHPYMLLNYNNNYESVSTLAHESGHAMHSYLANKTQPFAKAGTHIFVAEVASTFNERLLFEKSLADAKTDDERLFYLGSMLERIRQTFFRQTSFAEYELKIHEEVEQGRPLTGEKLSKMYGAILKKYYGDGTVMSIDPAYDIEWAFISHWYRNFYVYQYATSLTASSQFADDVLKGKPGAREKYLNFLKAGGSDYPYNLVAKSGVDLAAPGPYQTLMAWMNRIMDEIEGILKAQGR